MLSVVLKGQPLLSRQLHQLFPTPDRPALLAPYGLQGWYLLVETPAEHVLLPCFEVARAFYYASGQHLISYCLSRLALDRVCWPLASPDTTLHQTAHFCVAAPSLRHAEIRLFAELLFNPHCRQTIQRAHTRLAQCWARGRHRVGLPAPWLRLDWELGRDVRLQTCGESFY